MSAFSFYPTKNLGAIGDAGAIATADAALADLARQRRQYGWKTRYESDSPGINSRMDELQAGILRVKLRTLKWQVTQRQKWAGKYDAAVANNPRIQAQITTSGGIHAYHQYVVRCAQREELTAHLQSRGIPTAILYPSALHQQKAWQQSGEFAEAERAAAEVLALPLHPYLDELSINHVCSALNDF
jgi:dTDP-4-amino-4,6-dideoxygalactose transaminase